MIDIFIEGSKAFFAAYALGLAAGLISFIHHLWEGKEF